MVSVFIWYWYQNLQYGTLLVDTHPMPDELCFWWKSTQLASMQLIILPNTCQPELEAKTSVALSHNNPTEVWTNDSRAADSSGWGGACNCFRRLSLINFPPSFKLKTLHRSGRYRQWYRRSDMNTESGKRHGERREGERGSASRSHQHGSEQLAVTQRHNEARQQTAT